MSDGSVRRETGYVQNADSLVVHKSTCASANTRGRGDAWWFNAWHPDIPAQRQYARPCHRCLPDGLPSSEQGR